MILSLQGYIYIYAYQHIHLYRYTYISRKGDYSCAILTRAQGTLDADLDTNTLSGDLAILLTGEWPHPVISKIECFASV